MLLALLVSTALHTTVGPLNVNKKSEGQIGVTLNLFAIKSPWNNYALINLPSRNMLAENCPAEKMPLP